MKKKKILSIILILAAISIIVLVLLLLNSANIIKKTQTTSSELAPEIVNYFSDELLKRYVLEFGMPIEGLDDFLIIRAFPGIIPKDFNNVEALQGVYRFSNNELIFEESKEIPISSAQKTISNKGMKTLLENLSKRLNIEITDISAVDFILSNISDNEKTFCTSQSRNVEACIEIYQPVCGFFDPDKIECVTKPCTNTYANSCFACIDENVLYYEEGECEQKP